ncbi:phage major capsid protein [Pseudoclavibacter alba]|uniref:phage major capsid protein n=1 Tax=Pseudoclavibacter albus TaxID=272241 RepID=UPI0019CF712A|nr:phage major capsid protein [Pseudoclavibacter alba]MBN6777429.1 phage major capsid protein [Pseudoclavibacter alba]
MVMMLNGASGISNTPGLVPAPLATEILTKAVDQSVVKRLAGQTPMPLEGAAIAVQTGNIEAGVVAEGAAKPVGSTAYATKFMNPIKVAAIALVTKELTMSNPVRVLDNIQADLTNAITRAFDLAILHGRDAKTGGQIAGVEYVNQTTNRVELGTTAANAGGITGDLIAGYNLVVNGDQVNDNFDGFAFDSRVRGQLIGAVDVQGRPVFQQTVNLRDGMDNVLGLPAVYGKAVSGKIGASADTQVRGFGGDWSALKYGFAEQMTLRKSDQATIRDGDQVYDLFQMNMEAYLVEAIFGWVITDTKAFTAYDDKVTAAA